MHLAGHVSVAGDVAVAVVADVAVDSLVQRPEGRDVRIWLLVNHGHLEELVHEAFAIFVFHKIMKRALKYICACKHRFSLFSCWLHQNCNVYTTKNYNANGQSRNPNVVKLDPKSQLMHEEKI